MDRLETVRQVIDEILRQQPDIEERRAGFVHLYGVSAICVLLALKRGLDPQICATMGILHDIASYKTGYSTNHAKRGALEAQTILSETGKFTANEIDEIYSAISKHSTKDEIDEMLAELLKDADALQQYLYNPTLIWKSDIHWQKRVQDTLNELGTQHPAKEKFND